MRYLSRSNTIKCALYTNVSHTKENLVPKLEANLVLGRCPHCSVAHPNLRNKHQLTTRDHAERNPRTWCIYVCSKCGGVVSAAAEAAKKPVKEYYPKSRQVEDDIPEKPKSYLKQALESIHAPAGAVMLTASAVDSMLKLKSYTEGSLYSRIESAVNDHMITTDMATWAHEVRLDANDQRHADEDAKEPDSADAQRVIDFASALAEILFVLPKRVQRGINPEVKDENEGPSENGG